MRIKNKIELKEIIYNFYIKENLCDKEIGSKIGLSAFTVWRLRKEFGIKGIYHNQRKLIITPQVPITSRQISIIMGSLLGDCCIKRGINNKSYLSISHSVKQKEYLYWLYNELKTICPSSPSTYIAHEKYLTYCMASESRGDLFNIREKIYTPAKKVNEWWLNQINELSIAIWYMDDGSLNYVNRNKSHFSFATNSFGEDENFMLKNMFYEKFNIVTTVMPVNKGAKTQYNLFIAEDSFEKFINLISPYVIESMRYKLPGILSKNFLLKNIETDVDKETLDKLYNKELLTQKQIASVLNVSRGTVRKYMQLFGIQPRDSISAQLKGKNNKCKRETDGTFGRKSVNLNSEEEKKLNDLFLQIKKDGFPYVEKKPKERYIGIIDQMFSTDIKKYISQNNEISYCKTGIELCSAFCPQIYTMSYNGSLSPIDMFNNDEKLLDCIKKTIKYYNNSSNASIRQELKNHDYNRSVTIFPPMWAKIATQLNFTTGNLSVLDFCCGFGGRLIGNYASGIVSKYIGIDPIKENINGHNKIYEIIKQHSSLIGHKFETVFYKDIAENVLNYLEDKFDLVMTSPPYFNNEIYSKDVSQCYNQYPNYDLWKEKWLKFVLIKSFNLLKPNGKMIIFASNFNKYNFGDDCCELLKLISNNNVNNIKFKLPTIEYDGWRRIKKYDTAWIATKN